MLGVAGLNFRTADLGQIVIQGRSVLLTRSTLVACARYYLVCNLYKCNGCCTVCRIILMQYGCFGESFWTRVSDCVSAGSTVSDTEATLTKRRLRLSDSVSWLLRTVRFSLIDVLRGSGSA
nr:uncharacterized protein LOC112275871 [Physcomitrium patens]|eukprot:XP_024362344.1 uncharacterized protein LOC112275871 [Physcomitrella patens]